MLPMLFLLFGCSLEQERLAIPAKRPSESRWCFDYTGTLPYELVQRVDNQSYSIRKHFDVDFVVMIIPSLDERNLVELAAELFTK